MHEVKRRQTLNIFVILESSVRTRLLVARLDAELPPSYLILSFLWGGFPYTKSGRKITSRPLGDISLTLNSLFSATISHGWKHVWAFLKFVSMLEPCSGDWTSSIQLQNTQQGSNISMNAAYRTSGRGQEKCKRNLFSNEMCYHHSRISFKVLPTSNPVTTIQS